MIYVISDTHFCHPNIIKLCNRPFNSVEEMNEELIKRWNAVVGPEDTVIHCGDFIMGSINNIDKILPRLNGYIILIVGNHDTKNKIKKYIEDYSDKISVFENGYYLFYENCSYKFVHKPPQEDEVELFDNVIIIHGHIHNSENFKYGIKNVFNVSADAIDFQPLPLFLINNKSFIYNALKSLEIKLKGLLKSIKNKILH